MALTKATYSLIAGAPANVKDFGAVGDGVANDRAAIQAAVNSGARKIYFPSGTYWLGQVSTSAPLIDFFGAGNNISIITEKSVELRCQTNGSGIQPAIFYLRGNNHFRCGPIKFSDLGYSQGVLSGAVGVRIEATPDGSGSWGDVIFDAIYGSSLLANVSCSGGSSVDRVRGIHIKQLFSENVFYGFNSQNQGDAVKIDNFIAFQNVRSYFVYGVTDHHVNIFNRANLSTSGSVNISRSPSGFNTQGINVNYVSRNNTLGITHVLINHIDLLGGTISDIKVNVDIESSVSYIPVNFINYTGSGGSPTAAASSNLVYDITLSGSCDAQASPVEITASYASKGILNFISGKNFSFNSTIPTKFYLGDAKRSQAVTWSAASVAPAIGNGTLTSNYDIVDGLCHYTISLTAGSTTTFGTGEWSFSVPFAATVSTVGSVWALDSGTAYYIGACRIVAGGTSLACFNNSASLFSPTNPFTWAANDELLITITYPIS